MGRTLGTILLWPPIKHSPEFEVAWGQLQQVEIPTVQHPRCLAIPGFSNPVRWGGYLWFQYDSLPRFILISSDEPLLPIVGNTDEELCNRWMTLSAYLPFFRNHNILSAISQEPYVWDSVADASRSNIAVRYSLLPYWVSPESFLPSHRSNVSEWGCFFD
jgi:hypothetical protein